jgi:hypothetical protein
MMTPLEIQAVNANAGLECCAAKYGDAYVVPVMIVEQGECPQCLGSGQVETGGA